MSALRRLDGIDGQLAGDDDLDQLLDVAERQSGVDERLQVRSQRDVPAPHLGPEDVGPGPDLAERPVAVALDQPDLTRLARGTPVDEVADEAGMEAVVDEPPARTEHAGDLVHDAGPVVHVGVDDVATTSPWDPDANGSRVASAWTTRGLRCRAIRSWSPEMSQPIVVQPTSWRVGKCNPVPHPTSRQTASPAAVAAPTSRATSAPVPWTVPR
jgi:hypothetical protein